MKSAPSPRALLSATAAAAAASLAFTIIAATEAKAGQTYYVPISKAWTISGHGYGHGHGMSQYGAQGAALKGLGYRQIAQFYYPGTDWSDVKGNVRVLISSDTTADLQVKARSGLVLRDLTDPGRWPLPAKAGIDRWRLAPVPSGATAVQFHNANGWHGWSVPDRGSLASDGQFEADGPLTLYVPNGSDTVGKVYRGVLRSVRPFAGSTARDTVNVLSMDQYVQGVVPYEMPASWHQQALRAQAVAARTYAAWQRSQNPRRYWQICDTTSCQVYGGVAAEQTSSNNAVQATAGKILTWKGRPAMTQFSSSDGGWTSAGGQPYLPAKPDPYDDFAENPMHSWSTQVSAASLQNAHPEIGKLVDVRVTKRDGNGDWRGRVQQIVLDGTQGKALITGDDFRWAYGLRSTWFTIAPTPIIERWRHLGGDKSGLGRPASGEFAVASGSAQDFKHGRIFWNAATGAKEMRGPILAEYKAYGGPRSTLGWPATGMMASADGGHKVRFQHGRILSSVQTGAHVIYGRIMARWQQEGAAHGWLGYPTTNVVTLATGVRSTFQHGVITWDRATNTFTVKEL